VTQYVVVEQYEVEAGEKNRMRKLTKPIDNRLKISNHRVIRNAYYFLCHAISYQKPEALLIWKSASMELESRPPVCPIHNVARLKNIKIYDFLDYRVPLDSLFLM